MSLCKRCAKAEYHGFRRDGKDATLSFKCSMGESREQVTLCTEFERGKPKQYYRDGSEL